MEIFRAEWSLSGYMIDLVFQVAFLAAFVALTIRLWPAGIAETGFSSISNREFALAVVSTFTALTTMAVFCSICSDLISFLQSDEARVS